jgi:hypothetical protein
MTLNSERRNFIAGGRAAAVSKLYEQYSRES